MAALEDAKEAVTRRPGRSMARRWAAIVASSDDRSSSDVSAVMIAKNGRLMPMPAIGGKCNSPGCSSHSVAPHRRSRESSSQSLTQTETWRYPTPMAPQAWRTQMANQHEAEQGGTDAYTRRPQGANTKCGGSTPGETCQRGIVLGAKAANEACTTTGPRQRPARQRPALTTAVADPHRSRRGKRG